MKTAAGVFAVMALSMACGASAQVHRCTDKAGRTSYSDVPCSIDQSGGLMERRKSREAIYMERLQAKDAAGRERFQQARLEAIKGEPEAPRGRVVAQSSSPSANPHECRLAQREVDVAMSVQTGDRASKQAAVQAAQARASAACGTPEPASAAEPAPPRAMTAPQGPSIITHCTAGFCYDNQGGTYHRNGPFLIAPDGRTCTVTGTSVNCR